MKYIVTHCSATPPAADIGSEEIDRYHKSLGWKGCGYHEVIRRNGDFENALKGFPCRTMGRPAAHARGRDRDGLRFNLVGIGICLVGGVDHNDVPVANFTDEQYETFQERVEFYMSEYDIELNKVLGHRDVIRMFNTPDGPKACPCFDVQEFFDGLYGFDEEERKAEGTTKLIIPDTHLVRAGETFWELSRLYGIPLEVLSSMNTGYPSLHAGRTVRLR